MLRNFWRPKYDEDVENYIMTPFVHLSTPYNISVIKSEKAR